MQTSASFSFKGTLQPPTDLVCSLTIPGVFLVKDEWR